MLAEQNIVNIMLDEVAHVFGRYDPNLYQNCTVFVPFNLPFRDPPSPRI